MPMNCGLGCGKPEWKDGYCVQCWHRENARVGGAIAILTEASYTIPDTFPEEWTYEH